MSVLSRPWANILPVRPSRLVNKIDINMDDGQHCFVPGISWHFKHFKHIKSKTLANNFHRVVIGDFISLFVL